MLTEKEQTELAKQVGGRTMISDHHRLYGDEVYDRESKRWSLWTQLVRPLIGELDDHVGVADPIQLEELAWRTYPET